MKELVYLFENSLRACEIAGQDQEIDKKAMQQQLGYIRSEVQEIADALQEDYLVEVLDGCVDTLVTVFGMLQKLQGHGAWLEKAFVKTADNNLSKFPESKEVALQSQQFYLETKNKETKIQYNPEYKRYVIRDMQGKYLKCKGFVENNLSDCFPKEDHA